MLYCPYDKVIKMEDFNLGIDFNFSFLLFLISNKARGYLRFDKPLT